MKTKPTLEQLDLVIDRMRARLAGRNALLAGWFDETMRVMEARFAQEVGRPPRPGVGACRCSCLRQGRAPPMGDAAGA
ncbi:hypothetical protein [Rhizobium hidalgonense]|uniref:hypothetical protein n=1 Tax=Rhizobium hidalgonense TaxID=1538159 RepID=UPI001FDF02FD|nr:hypothetical protein [Rhizobium hidalgonense]